ncbi:MAG: ATP-dependent Clp protease adaptor ClpS [Ignavibacteriae bacterium]|nr:ATP-dependent Clp protease adaptor ClpS [Ignavibacteriota bacterium]
MKITKFNFELEKPENISLPEIDVEVSIETQYHVLLFNDDYHSFEEVIEQLIKAIDCTFEKARSFAFEVHVKGKALVFSGSLTKCLSVSSILEEISLNTQVST